MLAKDGEVVKQARLLTIQDVKNRIDKLKESGKYEKTIDDLVTQDEDPEMYNLIAGLLNEIQEKRSNFRPLSKRHASVEQSAIDSIEADPDIKAIVISLCEHSGGTKNTHSIIQMLQEKLGKGVISYADEDLKKYIEEVKKPFRGEPLKINEPKDAGKVGTEREDDAADDIADYMNSNERK